jgi:hypothetical protein
MCGICQFYRISVEPSVHNPKKLLTKDWTETHEHYTTQLLQWRSAFQVIHAEEVRAGMIRTDSSTMLSIYYNLAIILLAASVPHIEMLFDHCRALFAEIIFRCHQLLSNTDNPTNTSSFTLDMGTILPLAITAMKCRDKELHHQAIGLLWLRPRREGLCFETITVAHLCAWLSNIERVPEDTEQIPESARYIVTYLLFDSEERWMTTQVTSSQVNENGMHTFKETTLSW